MILISLYHIIYCSQWAIEHWKVDSSIGDGLVLYILTKTDNKEQAEKWVYGDVVKLSKNTNVQADDNVDKSEAGGTTKSSKNMGRITVTATAKFIQQLVDEAEGKDS